MCCRRWNRSQLLSSPPRVAVDRNAPTSSTGQIKSRKHAVLLENTSESRRQPVNEAPGGGGSNDDCSARKRMKQNNNGKKS
ncbi:hypothetical protein F2P81_011014 [Scophthalmus maximus]|uniref:Uncharacterized protein n=1 Tax=Scophthalmus maximus TaxID=52904 RepID=A0A6A4T0D3_SCOMX|nr:hypothetical protein F2P81_011014 [Scophthalmus maximus]